jgi:hypothetical protein
MYMAEVHDGSPVSAVDIAGHLSTVYGLGQWVIMTIDWNGCQTSHVISYESGHDLFIHLALPACYAKYISFSWDAYCIGVTSAGIEVSI